MTYSFELLHNFCLCIVLPCFGEIFSVLIRYIGMEKSTNDTMCVYTETGFAYIDRPGPVEQYDPKIYRERKYKGLKQWSERRPEKFIVDVLRKKYTPEQVDLLKKRVLDTLEIDVMGGIAQERSIESLAHAIMLVESDREQAEM